MTVLLDTHILLYWFGNRKELSKAQLRVIESVSAQHPLYVSEISLWEVATLFSLGRISLDLPVTEWLERAAAPPLVARVGISPAIAGQTTTLPATFHRDPADRIIVSTAKVLGATLMTNDRRIREASIVPTL